LFISLYLIELEIFQPKNTGQNGHFDKLSAGNFALNFISELPIVLDI